jgi:O-antigen ligase
MHWHFLTKETKPMVLFGLFGIAIGWLTQTAVEQATSGKNFLLALAPLMAPVLLIMIMRPVVGAVAVVGFAFVNPSLLPPLLEIGELSLRYFDVAFGSLICMIFARMAIRRRITISTEFRQLFAPVLLFLLYIGISLVVVRLSTPEFFAASVAAYIRLILTASFAVVLHLALKDSWDMHFFHKTLIIFAAAAVGIGAWLARTSFGPGDTEVLAGRAGGILGTGSLGLVSGLLLLYAVIKKDDKSCHSAQWMFSLLLGLLGLFLAKSAVSIFAAAGAVTVGLATMRSRRCRFPGLLRGVAVGTLMTVAAALAVWNVRNEDLSGIGDVSGGSFAERIMIGYAGIRVFLDNPLVGVGWQASTAEAVIGSHALKAVLMEKFDQLPAHYFLKPPTSLHNMYIQFLAELGIIGFILFIWVCCRMGKCVAAVMQKMPVESPYRTWTKFDILALIFLLIWWNGNPLFGGQTEWILAMTLVALLGTAPELERKRVKQLNSHKLEVLVPTRLIKSIDAL